MKAARGNSYWKNQSLRLLVCERIQLTLKVYSGHSELSLKPRQRLSWSLFDPGLESSFWVHIPSGPASNQVHSQPHSTRSIVSGGVRCSKGRKPQRRDQLEAGFHSLPALVVVSGKVSGHWSLHSSPRPLPGRMEDLAARRVERMCHSFSCPPVGPASRPTPSVHIQNSTIGWISVASASPTRSLGFWFA